MQPKELETFMLDGNNATILEDLAKVLPINVA